MSLTLSLQLTRYHYVSFIALNLGINLIHYNSSEYQVCNNPVIQCTFTPLTGGLHNIAPCKISTPLQFWQHVKFSSKYHGLHHQYSMDMNLKLPPFGLLVSNTLRIQVILPCVAWQITGCPYPLWTHDLQARQSLMGRAPSSYKLKKSLLYSEFLGHDATFSLIDTRLSPVPVDAWSPG